jgi:ubiquinone/menaquinone biosynthesis C-methylase UbiE
MEEIITFYTEYDEESRLQRHPAEFTVSTFYMKRYIAAPCSLLDVAAGTGAYAMFFADLGCTVSALDITPRYIHILRGKIRPGLQITANVNDARDLSRYDDNIFDAVLNMGPVYHLNIKDIALCLQESLRVLKTNGIFVLAYVNKFDGYENDRYFSQFKFHSYSNIEKLMAALPVSKLEHVPVDGPLYEKLEHYIQQGHPLHQCHQWLDENPIDPATCGYSLHNRHGLYIGQKNVG